MSRYKPDKFNFSGMSERVTFQVMDENGDYIDSVTIWAHVLKDGFTRTENENWFRLMVRERAVAPDPLLNVGNRIKWRRKLLSIFSWQDPSYEDKRFIEIMAKQIATLNSDGTIPGPADGDLFKDIVSIFKMTRIEENKYGLVSYKYDYDFTKPAFTGVRCLFSTDRNVYLDEKKIDVEHDSVIVKFNLDTPLEIEDYIESPVHGRFKVDIILKNNDNMLEAYCQRSEIQ